MPDDNEKPPLMRERGTIENLPSMPTRPGGVLIGRIVPYILFGYAQVCVLWWAARFLFHWAMHGSIPLLLAAVLLFVAANLALGITICTVALNQLQAMQRTFFIFLPSLQLSGFMFPFRGMPRWAQTLGGIFPLTHFLRIVRGVLLKDNGAGESGRWRFSAWSCSRSASGVTDRPSIAPDDIFTTQQKQA